jgi:rRNA processing protein Gar1
MKNFILALTLFSSFSTMAFELRAGNKVLSANSLKVGQVTEVFDVYAMVDFKNERKEIYVNNLYKEITWEAGPNDQTRIAKNDKVYYLGTGKTGVVRSVFGREDDGVDQSLYLEVKFDGFFGTTRIIRSAYFYRKVDCASNAKFCTNSRVLTFYGPGKILEQYNDIYSKVELDNGDTDIYKTVFLKSP